jgi:hypothetical protein
MPTTPVRISWFFSSILLIQQKNFIVSYIPTWHSSNQVMRDHKDLQLKLSVWRRRVQKLLSVLYLVSIYR